MSFKLRILLGFAILLLIGLLQVGQLLWATNRIGSQVESVFAGPFARADAARAAKADFGVIDALAHEVLAMTAPVDSGATLPVLAAARERLRANLEQLGPRDDEQVAELAASIETWLGQVSVLLGETPAATIPAPHLLKRLNAEIAQGLDAVVEDTVSEALGMRGSLVGDISGSQTLSLLLTTVGLALGVAAALLLARSLTGPLARIEATMAQLAAGRLSVDVPFVGRRDEIGAMARAVEIFKANALERERLNEASRLTQAQREERSRSVDAMIARFEAAAGALLEDVRAAATQLNEAAAQLDAASAAAASETGGARRAVEIANNDVATAASATEQMSSSIAEIAEQAARSNHVGAQAVDEARRTASSMSALSEKTQRIGEIVGLIQGVAAQTNLLALNATIEAARAGEAGRGFAVVASEVKNLATQTARATEEIATQIQAVQSASDEAADVIERVRAIIQDMAGIAGTVAAAVEEQNAGVRQISQSVASASGRSGAGMKAMLSVESSVAEATRTVGAVRRTAEDLTQQAQALEARIGDFLRDVKAA